MRKLLFCVALFGCGTKPAASIVPESGEYAASATYAEIVCMPFVEAEVGGPYGAFLVDLEGLDDGSIRAGDYSYEQCSLDNGTLVCSRSSESDGADPTTDTHYFWEIDLEVVWDSTTTGSGTYTEAWVCEGEDCDQSNDGCLEGYWSLELYLTRLGDLSED